MINIYNYTRVKLLDICDVERAKKNKIYKAGSVALQVSATHGDLIFLEKDSIVETKYAVIIPKIEIEGKYLKYVIGREMEKFLYQNQSGINIQINSLGALYVDVHNDIETQKYVMQCLEKYEDMEKKENEFINKLKDIKSNYLATMFVDTKVNRVTCKTNKATVPEIRWSKLNEESVDNLKEGQQINLSDYFECKIKAGKI